MNRAKDLVSALQMHYTTSRNAPKYGQKMAETIVDQYAWMSERYEVMLFDEIVRTFEPTTTRPLPDLAAIAKAQRALPDPSMLVEPKRESRVELEKTDKLIRARVNEKAKAEGELNHEERERVRAKVRKGDATKWEVRWLRVIEEHKGDWRRAHSVLGDVQEEQHA